MERTVVVEKRYFFPLHIEISYYVLVIGIYQWKSLVCICHPQIFTSQCKYFRDTWGLSEIIREYKAEYENII